MTSVLTSPELAALPKKSELSAWMSHKALPSDPSKITAC